MTAKPLYHSRNLKTLAKLNVSENTLETVADNLAKTII